MLPFHPLANLFPLIEGAAFDELVADVRANGVRERIVLLDGMIIDGRNRYRAALAAGVLQHTEVELALSPRFGRDAFMQTASQFAAFSSVRHGDPLAWVLSKNLHRRHLNESQRTLIAAEIARMRPGRPAESGPAVEGVSADEKPANWRDKSVRQAEAADMLNVSERSVQRGRQVIEHAAPEVVEQVRRGDMAISAASALSELPVTEQLAILRSADPRAISRLAREQRDRLQAAKADRRAEREAELGARQVALPTMRYGVILADPEWQFVVRSAAGMDRAADNHYPTSDIDVIRARDVASIAADDCVLFLWATVPMLLQALDVMAAWGFAYKSNFNWHKDRIGTGYWSRNRHEHLLVGVRGEVPAPAMGTQFDSSIEAAVGAHSAKPERFYELIDAYFPSLPKIELNARVRRAGWDAWGLEAPAAEPTGNLSGGEVSAHQGHEGYARLAEAPAAETENPQADVDADIEAQELIELQAAPAPAAGAAPTAPAGADASSGPQPSAPDLNAIIREAYARNAPLSEVVGRTGLSLAAVKNRALRLGITDPSRQRNAVAQANRRRKGAPASSTEQPA